ncbi:SLC30A1 [Lepeophtheirus salmonis]|uniref:SLC30A1 n=1 Tax=Lepeophtheirus salmonis TaxID=72036 RepID=A0A7R8CGD5_LEPSM|nr:SLC30A1 [Lepeophtheirus salmonis]CAF2757871.1 SLC30A1 [Lepeophtheirus salmonis]
MSAGLVLLKTKNFKMVNSMALVADSFHMLSDVIALIVAFVAVHVSPKDWSKNTFGYARAEVLGALINAVFLLALCFTIFVESIKRFVIVEPISKPKNVLIVGGIGLLVNVLGLLLFHDAHGHSHGSHGHGHSHGKSDEKKQAQGGSQMNMKGVFLHICADALGSVIVMISASVIWLVDWEYEDYIDPALSLALKYATLRKKIVAEFPEVAEVHEFHVWNLVGSRIVASLHVTLKRQSDNNMEISRKIKEFFHRQGIHSTTIQLEYGRSLLFNGIGGTTGDSEKDAYGSKEKFISILPLSYSSPNKISSCTLQCPVDEGYGGNPTELINFQDCSAATCCGPRSNSLTANPGINFLDSKKKLEITVISPSISQPELNVPSTDKDLENVTVQSTTL